MVSFSQAVWISLISAGIALLGMFLANRQRHQQRAMQLQHDAEHAERDRLLLLRREVYLSAAEAIAGLTAMLGPIVHLGTSEHELSTEIGKYIGPLARVQLIGGDETVRTVSRLQREMSAALVSVLSGRSPLISRQADIDVARRAMHKCSTEIDAASASMRELDAADRFDQHRWDAAELHLQFARTQHAKHLNDWQSLTAVQNRDLLQYVETAMRDFSKLGTLVAPAMTALRAELQLRDGSNTLTSELEGTARRMQEVMDELLATLRKQFETGGKD